MVKKKNTITTSEGNNIYKAKPAPFPKIIKPPWITREHQKYLHSQIAEHVAPLSSKILHARFLTKLFIDLLLILGLFSYCGL